jgi:hypothetical protein
MCRAYQNCASESDSQGQGSHPAQLPSAQLILNFPSGVLLSTGRCARRPRRQASLIVCMSFRSIQNRLPGRGICRGRLARAAAGAAGHRGRDRRSRPSTTHTRARPANGSGQTAAPPCPHTRIEGFTPTPDTSRRPRSHSPDRLAGQPAPDTHPVGAPDPRPAQGPQDPAAPRAAAARSARHAAAVQGKYRQPWPERRPRALPRGHSRLGRRY